MAAAEFMIDSVVRGSEGWQQRPLRLSLCTYVCAIYMMNGINYGSGSEQYADVVRPCMRHVIRRDPSLVYDQGQPRLVPDTGCGAWFVADYVKDELHAGLQRVAATGMAIEDNRLAVAYGRASYPDLISIFGNNFFHPHTVRPPNINRSRNRFPVALISNQDEEDLSEVFHPDVPFRVDEDLTLLPPRESVGQDTRDVVAAGLENALDEDRRTDSVYIKENLGKAWRQLPVDVVTLAPNRKAHDDASHCLLTEGERRDVKPSIFRSSDLSALFKGAHVSYLNPNQWVDTFRNVFTRRQIYRGANQNLPNMPSYRIWAQLAGRVADKDFDRLEKPLLDQFKKLMWFPDAKSDKVWKTLKSPLSGSEPEGTHGVEGCPRVFIAVNLAVYESQPYRLRFWGEELRRRRPGDRIPSRAPLPLRAPPLRIGPRRPSAAPSNGTVNRFSVELLPSPSERRPVTIANPSAPRGSLDRYIIRQNNSNSGDRDWAKSPRQGRAYSTPEPGNWLRRSIQAYPRRSEREAHSTPGPSNHHHRQQRQTMSSTPVVGGEIIDLTSEDSDKAGEQEVDYFDWLSHSFGPPVSQRQLPGAGDMVELSSSDEDEPAFPITLDALQNLRTELGASRQRGPPQPLPASAISSGRVLRRLQTSPMSTDPVSSPTMAFQVSLFTFLLRRLLPS
jgi:hypothetical protein